MPSKAQTSYRLWYSTQSPLYHSHTTRVTSLTHLLFRFRFHLHTNTLTRVSIRISSSNITQCTTQSQVLISFLTTQMFTDTMACSRLRHTVLPLILRSIRSVRYRAQVPGLTPCLLLLSLAEEDIMDRELEETGGS